jgi:hypothetical protein
MSLVVKETPKKKAGQEYTRKPTEGLQTKPEHPTGAFKGLNIGRQWRIGADSLNIILYRQKGKKGKERWRTEAYFSTISNALTYLVDAEVRETGLRDLKEVAQKQDELYALIKNLDLLGEPSIEPLPSDVLSV